MNLGIVKSEALITELMNRCSDQLGDPEPQFDDVMSFMTEDEIDWFMGELINALNKQKVRK